MDVAVEAGARHVLAISLMAGGEYEARGHSWGSLIARTLQLALHHRMLSDFQRLRARATVVVLCPVLGPTEGWDLRQQRVDAMIEGARRATADLIRRQGHRLFKRSAIHYLELQSDAPAATA